MRLARAGAATWQHLDMCGRYVIAFDPETLVGGFTLARAPAFPRRWNVAPQSQVPVVYETREGERVAELMRWGLAPHWAKDPAIGQRLNNARADGVFDKPSFRMAVRRRRCLLPASGFYEWQARPSGKQPWYVTPRDEPWFAMAGLFEAWRPAGADDASPWLLTCCVITTGANALMAPIHDRMPVMVAPDRWAAWLSRSEQRPEAIAALLATPEADSMQAWPVSRAVNRGSAEGEGLVAPVDLELGAAPG
jgi:putative SOS response-associated peptidase YedK